MTVTLGSLCSGYGGLDLAVEHHYGATTVWQSEFDKDCSTLLAHRWPGVPNLGDLTVVDWETVPPVDVMCGGFPCQPFSTAGRRLGEEDERAIFHYIAGAIRVLRPRIFVAENVSAITSLGGPGVIATLAGLGYDCRWLVVRAADARAPHRRARWFCLATDSSRPRLRGLRGELRGELWGEPGGVAALLPTPRAALGDARNSRPWIRPLDKPQNLENAIARLLPTPCSRDWKDTGENTNYEKIAGKHRLAGVAALLPTPTASEGNSPGIRKRGQDLRTTVPVSLLPTPTTVDSKVFGPRVDWKKRAENHAPHTASVLMHPPGQQDWGKYESAIARWAALTRPPPAPTDDRGLLPGFVEWMMGLPGGWVTDLGLSRTAQLKMLGNGVVPAQAALALELLDPNE